MKYHQTSFFILSLLAIVLTACSEDIRNGLGLGHEIAFKIMPSQPAATRSAAEDKVPEPQPFVCQGDTFYLQTEITPMDSTMGQQVTTRGAEKNASNLQADGFKVSAYNTSDGTTRGTSYFEYLTATYADSKFTPQDAGTAKYWPTGKLMFYAYYPAATASNGITQGANASTLTYTVPSTPANQPDLMTARATDQQYTSGDGTAALTFNHALCAIKFQTGTDIAGGTINSITFNNIYTSGTYNLDTQTWSSTTSGNKSFTGLSKTTTEGTSGTAILTGDNTLMMIPQTFDNNNQTITIDFTVGGTPHTLSYVLNGTSWGQGQCITYTITTEGLVWEYVLEATGGETAHTGGNVNLNVKSYRYKRTNPSVVEPVAWTIDGYKANGASDFSTTKPSWITISTTNGIGTTTTSAVNTVTTTVAAQTSSPTAVSFTDVERGTSSAPYDLSTKGGTTTRNTANCYIVNGPGWYIIPLVYGNGIKNGVNNTSAYSTSTFIDYNGTQIKNLSGGPYINKSGTPNNAVIVWQDVNNLLDNVSYYNAAPGYIKFHVGTNMKEGNSLIAIRDGSNNIMWSWHIWVSAMDIDNTIPTKTSDNARTYHLMPVMLGWVNTSNVSVWQKRNIEFRLKQTDSNVSTTVIIYQNPYCLSGQSGFAPFYQWGRKDPQVPTQRTGTNGETNTNKAIYNGIISAFTPQQGTETLANTIKKPHIYYYSTSYMWQSNLALYDMWNVGNSSYANDLASAPHQNVVKSVYDPSPYGYKIPPAKAFTGLTSSTYNVWGSYVTTNYSPSQTIFIPRIGKRRYDSTGFTTGPDYEGLFWSSLPVYPPGDGSGSTGAKAALLALYTTDNSLIISGRSATNWGYNVWPVGENDN